jgi:hypothetical protein
MNRFVVLTLVARALLAVGFSTAALADQKLPKRLNQVAQPSPEAVVIIKSWPVGEQEATKADIVLKPPDFAERNRLGARPVIADPVVVDKKVADTQQIVRRTVRSRVSRVKKVRVNSRRTSSPSWIDKAWEER